MDYSRFRKWHLRALLGILNAGLALGVTMVPYISVNTHQYYIYDLPGTWWHFFVFAIAAILAVVAIKSFTYDFALPILGGLAAAIDLTFTLGIVFLGVDPELSMVTASAHIGAIFSIGALILLLVQGYIWLQLWSEDLRSEKSTLKETNSTLLEKTC